MHYSIIIATTYFINPVNILVGEYINLANIAKAEYIDPMLV